MKNTHNTRSADPIETLSLKHNIHFFMHLKYTYLKERSQHNYFANDARGISTI